MKTLIIRAVWQPKPGSISHARDIEGVRAQQGNRVWINPAVTVEEMPDNYFPGPGQVLIKTRACGLCGSDIAMANKDDQGYVLYPYMMSSPIVPGHEPSGTVAAIGKKVKKFRVGDPVTAQCVINCFSCSMCKQGRYDECERNEERGFTVNGACAEYFLADERHVYSLEKLASRFSGARLYLAGSTIEPLAGTYKALKDHGIENIEPRIRRKGTALVIGAGPIGIAAMLNLAGLGIKRVIMAEVSAERIQHARRLGANLVINSALTPLAETVLDATHGNGVLLVFEATGALKPKRSEEKINLWEEIMTLFLKQRERPRLIFFGQSKENLSFNPQLFIQRYAVFTGSHGHCGVWAEVINHVAKGHITDPSQMITRTIALSEAPKWLARLKTDKQELKVAITDFAN